MNPTKETTAVWVALNLAQRTVFRTMDATLKTEGLPPLRWYDVLWELEQSADGVRPFELERRVIFEQSNLSRLVQRLVGEGLVKEAAYEHDGRGKLLLITDKGRRLRKRMWAIYGPLIQKLVGKVPQDHDAKLVTAALRSLID